MLCLFQIYEQGTGRCHSERKAVDCKTFERVDLELSFELLHGTVVDKCPFLKRRDVIMRTVTLAYAFFISSRHKEFLWGERAQKGSDIIQRAFSYLKSTRRDIQEGCSALILAESEAGNEIVFLLLKKLFVESDSRSDKFGHSPLYNILCEFRIFKLVTDSDLISRPDKSRKICLQGMERETGHRESTWNGAGALCEHDSENLAGNKRIISVCFVEIAASEKQDCFRVIRLECEILLHHRGFGRFFLCHRMNFI